jgi:predicted PurR-regulated permease PerM
MEQHQSLFSLSIDPVTKSHLNDTARWAKFLSIVGMVVLLLALAGTILGLTLFSNSSSVVFSFNNEQSDQVTNAMKLGMVIGTIIMVTIAFFPLLFLLQFANRMKRALAANEQDDLNDAFLQLKKYFRYLGIIVIIVLALYALMFILAIMGTALSS